MSNCHLSTFGIVCKFSVMKLHILFSVLCSLSGILIDAYYIHIYTPTENYKKKIDQILLSLLLNEMFAT